MNLAIFKKGSNKVDLFILDCIQTGNNFAGSNIKAHGLKDRHYDFVWTNDMVEPITEKQDEKQQGIVQKMTYAKGRKDITPAPVYNGKSVGSRKDVNKIVVEQIRKKYSTNDELKILRLKSSGASDFGAYTSYVNQVVSEAKEFKDIHFKEEV